jgi:hypothetical protein
MPVSAAEAFHAWHDFYVLTATIAATLVGAMFVVASIGSNLLTPRSESAIQAFLTPTVVHLSGIILASAAAAIPSLDALGVEIVFGGGGTAGVAYSLYVAWRVIHRHEVERVDHIWYAALPFIAYVVAVAAAVLLLLHKSGVFEVLASGVLLLLVASIRNAWDMIIFFASRDNAMPPGDT